MKYNNQMTHFTIKFYSHGTKLTDNMDNRKTYLVKEFNRLSGLSFDEISKELGLSKDLEVTRFFLYDNLADKIILDSDLL